jgi:hypothetical protein
MLKPFNAAIAVGNIYRGTAYRAFVTNFNDNDANDRIGSGVAWRQDPTAFNQNSFAGTYAFLSTGQNPSLQRYARVGLISYDNALNVTSTMFEANDGGTLSSTSSPAGNIGTYTAPDSNGRIVISFTSGLSAVVYIVSANQYFFMTLDSRATHVLSQSTALRQQNPGMFGNGSLAGPDVVSLMGDPTGGSHAIVGLATASGGTLSITFDENNAGTVNLNQTISGSYTVAANGTSNPTLTGTFGTANLFIVLAAQDRGFVMSGGNSVGAGTINPQVGNPFSASPFSGPVFIGQQEKVEASGDSFSGVGTLPSAGTLSFSTDSSHPNGILKFGEAGMFNFSVAPNGRFTSVPNAQTDGLTGYLTSSFEAAIFEVVAKTGQTTPSMNPHVTWVQSVMAPKGTPSPASLTVNFPNPVAVGATAQSAAVTITNTGLGPLAFPSVDATASPDFSASGTCITVSVLVVIQPGASCTVIITFAPTASTATGTALCRRTALRVSPSL